MGQSLDSMGRRQSNSKDELLYQAAIAGNIEAVKALCSDGARFEWFDQEGKTALIAVCLSPDLYHVAKTLIELGANVNAYRPGRNAGTSLHHAAQRGCAEIVKLLLSHGANALVMNDDCQTPLDVARMKGFTSVVRLIEHHISFFTGWLREFHGPSFLGALAPQLLSKKIWVVVVPRGPVNPFKPVKLELAIYNTLEDSEPRTIVSLWMTQIEKPKFDQQNMVLRILDKSNGCRYKLGPAIDGDKQQIQLFYSACLGVRQITPSIGDPVALSSVNTSESTAEEVELAMAISASIQTANEGRPPLPSNSSVGSAAASDWENSSCNGVPNNTTCNGWGPSEVLNEPGSSNNGWADQPEDSSCNGWGAPGTSTHQTLLIPTHDNVSSQLTMNNDITGIGLVNPTAPPLPVDGFDEGLIHYPSIDTSPVALPNPTDDKGATGVKTDASGSACCIICWDAPVQGACIPCGHMAGCMPCLSEIKSKKGDCPVCRTKINQIIRLYAV